ncbi:unnamed protein product [Alternaria alternata]
MSFWSSERNPVAAATVLWDIGRGLSELEGEGELLKEHTIFLEKLKNTLEAVNKVMKEGPILQGLQDDITAIWNPLLETEVEIVFSMGLNEDEVKTEDMKSVASKFYLKTAYYQRFSSKITRLQNEVVIPLLGLHRSITTMFPQKLSRSWQTIKRWAAESKRCIDERMVLQSKGWLRPLSLVEEKSQAYMDIASSSKCEWFCSKQEYIDWYNQLSKRSSPILWISGIPGIGRTQIAATIVQKLREDKRTVAYFFYGEETTAIVNARKLMVTLCWNLLNQFPEDVELLSEVCNKDGEPTETEVQTVLQRMCERRDAIIVLDGLDECFKLKVQGENEIDKFCQFLASSNGVCDVIMFSQELEDIKRGLSKYNSIPRISNCEADFWDEIEKIPTRCAAGFGLSEEKEQGVVDAEVRSCEVIEEHNIYFPGSREDQCQVYAMLRHSVCGLRLPAHIARQIVDEAEYWVKATFERSEPLMFDGKKCKSNFPYLLSDPIDGARHFPVRNVIATCSHSQAWASYPDRNGDYRGSSIYFDFVVRDPDGSIRNFDPAESLDLFEIQQHLGTPKKPNAVSRVPYNEKTSWMCLITPGSRLGVIPKAIGWISLVEVVRIEIFSTFLEEEHGQHEALRRFKQKKEEILEQIWNTRKQTRLLTDNRKGVEQELPNAVYKKQLQLNNWDRDNVQSLEKQNEPLLPSTDNSLIYTRSALRSPRSPLSVYHEDADQIRPSLVSKVLKHSNTQIPLDDISRNDKNFHSSTSTTFVRMIRELVRPKVRPGYKRLEWTCTCGEPLYGDFEEKTSGSLDQLAAKLKQQSSQSSQHGASAPIPQPKKAYTRQAQAVGYNMPGSGSSSSNDPNNLVSNAVSSHLNTVKPPPSTALQLCIETGKYKLEMSELARPSPAVSDGELFAMIREKYESTRHSILPTWARFKKPNRAIFVKFLLGTKRTVSLNNETPSIPPATEVRHNYDYDPCPMEIPPMDSRVFFHHFYAPRSQHSDVFWGNRLPWKVKPLLGPSNHG